VTATHRLVDSQSGIATSERDNLLVVAPPGCGKTEILAKRAAFLVGLLRPGQKILALTFSNKAQQNLRERLARELGSARCRRYITVRNFHGHATEVLRAHARTIGLPPDFPLPGKRTLKLAIDPYTADLPIGLALDRRSEIEAALRTMKQQPLDDHEVLAALANGGYRTALSIERDRQRLGLLHYDDLLRHAQRLLQIKPVANLYQQHYGALLVDEFQDLSPQQLDIALRSVTTHRTFVGDPLQGIYTWAGARPDLVETELRQLCGEPMRLTISYRSSPAVLAVVNPIAESMGSPPLSSARPEQWCENGASAAIVFSTEEAESGWIVNTARSILARDNTATIGVITRSGWRRQGVDRAFAKADVPSTQWDLAVENPQIVEALRSTAKGLPNLASIDDLEARALVKVSAADVDTYHDMVDAIDQLRGFASQTGSIAEAFAKLPVRNPGEVIGPGVHLLNAHTGKGQQFDWVFVPGFEGFHIPDGRAESEAELREELRVLLVMLSRARHGVVLSRAAERISNRGKPYQPEASKWWALATAPCGLSRQEFEAHVDRYERT
jgi:DNA helicase II / ATP-dependent DNA helicase PcrA